MDRLLSLRVFPVTAYPFEGFTLNWFVKLWNHRAMMEGLRNSIIIGLGVVAVSVPVGLAAAIIMSQIYHRARGTFYLVTVSPVLTPGVIIGISTVIFWKDMMGMTDVTKAWFVMTQRYLHKSRC